MTGSAWNTTHINWQFMKHIIYQQKYILYVGAATSSGRCIGAPIRTTNRHPRLHLKPIPSFAIPGAPGNLACRRWSHHRLHSVAAPLQARTQKLHEQWGGERMRQLFRNARGANEKRQSSRTIHTSCPRIFCFFLCWRGGPGVYNLYTETYPRTYCPSLCMQFVHGDVSKDLLPKFEDRIAVLFSTSRTVMTPFASSRMVVDIATNLQDHKWLCFNARIKYYDDCIGWVSREITLH